MAACAATYLSPLGAFIIWRQIPPIYRIQFLKSGCIVEYLNSCKVQSSIIDRNLTAFFHKPKVTDKRIAIDSFYDAIPINQDRTGVFKGMSMPCNSLSVFGKPWPIIPTLFRKFYIFTSTGNNMNVAFFI